MTPSSSAAMASTGLNVDPTALDSWMARFSSGVLALFFVYFL